MQAYVSAEDQELFSNSQIIQEYLQLESGSRTQERLGRGDLLKAEMGSGSQIPVILFSQWSEIVHREVTQSAKYLSCSMRTRI